MNNGDKLADTYVTSKFRNGQTYSSVVEGLTKREHFAGLAMQAVMADSEWDIPVSRVGNIAVQAADALLKALEESK